MRNTVLVLTLIAAMLTVVPAAAQATNPPLADSGCGFPAGGVIVQSVTYTLEDDCIVAEKLGIRGSGNIIVTINGKGHTIFYSDIGESATALLVSENSPCTGHAINLNQVTIDAGGSIVASESIRDTDTQLSRVLTICGSLTANQVTFRGGYGGPFLIAGNAQLTDTLFEDNVSLGLGNYSTNTASAMLVKGSATFHNVVLRGNLYSAAAVRLRGESEEAQATLRTTGCLGFAGNVPLNIDDEFHGVWTDKATGPCEAGDEIGNGAEVRAAPQPDSSCGLPLGGLPDSGNLIESRVYSLTADCDLRGSLYISEGLKVTIKGNGHTIRTGVNARIELADNSTLTIENVHLDGVRILNFGEMTLRKISISNMPNAAILDFGKLTISNMLADSNLDPVVYAYFGYGEGITTIEDSVIRNTDATARGRSEALERAALYARGKSSTTRPASVSITLKGCIIFENNKPVDEDGNPINTLAVPDGKIVDESDPDACPVKVGPDPPAARSNTPEPDDDDDDDPDSQPSPTPTATPNVYMPSERSVVYSGNDDLQYEPVDIITLDKHPALQGGRFAVRLWRFSPQCNHRVVADDNLYRLAIQYQETMETLRSLNGIVGDQLSIGQYLLFPSCVRDGSLAFENTRICFEDQGNLVFIDTSMSPPQVSTLEKYPVNGMTCANVDQPGLVVLTALDS